jgi:hypothetical protein
VDDSGRSTTHYTTDSRATYRSSTLITVDIPAVRQKRQAVVNKRADGFEISLSYDGIKFGKPMAFLIFDDLCFDCNSTVTCSKLVSYKFLYLVVRHDVFMVWHCLAGCAFEVFPCGNRY